MVEARDRTSALRGFLEQAVWLPPHAPRHHLLQRGDLGILLAARRRLGVWDVPPAEGPVARGTGGDRQGFRDPTPAPCRSLAGFLGQEARSPNASARALGPCWRPSVVALSTTGTETAHVRRRP